MWNWIVRQYNDIKGNIKYAILAALWWPVISLARKVLQYIPHIPNWTIWPILLVMSLAAFLWIAKSFKSVPVQIMPPAPPQQRPIAAAPFPSISALQGQPSPITFDSRQWFRVSHFSPLTAEVENNIKIIARNAEPNDPEAFYARFIGVGLVSYLHEMTWAYIFKSQLIDANGIESSRNDARVRCAKVLR